MTRYLWVLTLMLAPTLLALEAMGDDVATTTAPDNSACTQAIANYSAARATIGAQCTAALKKSIGLGDDASCHTDLAGCARYSQELAENSCLSQLAGTASPTAKTCEEVLRPSGANIRCHYISSLDENALNSLERTRADAIADLMREQNNATRENSSFVQDLTKGLTDLQKEETKIREQIAALRAQLEKIGPQLQQELQDLTRNLAENLEKIDLGLHDAVQKLKQAKVAQAAEKARLRQECQQSAAQVFSAMKQQREAMNMARRNSTSLNNLTGNAQRFEATFKQYLNECLQSDMFAAEIKRIEDTYKMAEESYAYAQKRVHQMRQRLEQDYQNSQRNLQENARVSMQNLVNQMQNLEQQIQQLRVQMIAQQAQAQTTRKEQEASLNALLERMTDANNSKTAIACVRACSGHVGGSVSAKAIEAIDSAFQTAISECDSIRFLCPDSMKPAECRNEQRATRQSVDPTTK
jgi:myosin heavy subunit